MTAISVFDSPSNAICSSLALPSASVVHLRDIGRLFYGSLRNGKKKREIMIGHEKKEKRGGGSRKRIGNRR